VFDIEARLGVLAIAKRANVLALFDALVELLTGGEQKR
jgi:hypothetical protein